MNTLKQPRKQKKAPGKVAKFFVRVLSGNIFSKEEVVKHLPFFFFMAFLALVYIANGYLAEDTVRQLSKTDSELKELRSEYITTKSNLMHKSKQSEVAEMLKEKGLGLKESIEPPKKIVVTSIVSED